MKRTNEKKNKSVVFENAQNNITEISISKIYPNPKQPRKAFDQNALNDLANSISKHGVIMPIIVNKSADDDNYMIIAGERRYRASKIAGLPKIPVIIKNYDARQIKEISLIENLQREDLNPIEAATAMQALIDDYNLTQEDLAERIGKSRSAIANTLRLLSLAEEVLPMVVAGKLSAGHARTILPLPKEEQVNFAKKIEKDGISVRDTEKLVKAFFEPPKEKEKKPAPPLSIELRELVEKMQRTFGTKVNAIGNDNKGRIYIDYYTRDDLDRILEIIEKINEKQR